VKKSDMRRGENKATQKPHSTELKVKIAVEALKGQKTMNELASVYSVHPHQISRWKQEVLEILTAGFSRRRERAAKDELELRERLYSQIGQLEVELDWLKKSLDWPL
jgi:transposase-like protein